MKERGLGSYGGCSWKAGSKTEGIEFFLRVSGAIYVVKSKMMRRTPIHRLTEGPTRVEEEFGAISNICIW